MINQQPEAQITHQTKKISASLIMSWIFSAFFIFTGAAQILLNPLYSLIYFLMAVIVFPPFHYFLEKKLGLQLTKGVKILLTIIGFFVIGLLEIRQDSLFNERPIIITAQNLYEKYTSNEILADNFYKGKLLEVLGSVVTIGKNNIILKGNSLLSFVNCELRENEKLRAATIKSGQVVIVEGKNKGKNSKGIIYLKYCKILDIKPASEEAPLPQNGSTNIKPL